MNEQPLIIVKKKLWNYGYSAKHLKKTEFDLLVNEKFRVKVGSSPCYKIAKNGYGWKVKCPDTAKWDVLVVVLSVPTGKPYVFYLTRLQAMERVEGKFITFKSKEGESLVGETSPHKVFGHPRNGKKG